MTTNQKKVEYFTAEETRIMLLEQKNDAFHQTLIEIKDSIVHLETKLTGRMDSIEIKLEGKIDSLDSRTEGRIDKLESKMDHHFKWLLGIIFATSSGILGVMGHALHWF